MRRVGEEHPLAPVTVAAGILGLAKIVFPSERELDVRWF